MLKFKLRSDFKTLKYLFLTNIVIALISIVIVSISNMMDTLTLTQTITSKYMSIGTIISYSFDFWFYLSLTISIPIAMYLLYLKDKKTASITLVSNTNYFNYLIIRIFLILISYFIIFTCHLLIQEIVIFGSGTELMLSYFESLKINTRTVLVTVYRSILTIVLTINLGILLISYVVNKLQNKMIIVDIILSTLLLLIALNNTSNHIALNGTYDYHYMPIKSIIFFFTILISAIYLPVSRIKQILNTQIEM